MTKQQQSDDHGVPCMYAKVMVGLLTVLVAVVLASLGYVADVSDKSDRHYESNRTLITAQGEAQASGLSELRTDIKYIREAVSKIEARQHAP